MQSDRLLSHTCTPAHLPQAPITKQDGAQPLPLMRAVNEMAKKYGVEASHVLQRWILQVPPVPRERMPPPQILPMAASPRKVGEIGRLLQPISPPSAFR